MIVTPFSQNLYCISKNIIKYTRLIIIYFPAVPGANISLSEVYKTYCVCR